MRQALTRHPDFRCDAVERIEVEVARPRHARLVLHYVVTGRVDDVRLPSLAAPTRTDELWQHTCLETFICPTPGAAYYEFNFAPSRQWAAYAFTGHRKGMRVATDAGTPVIDVELKELGFELHASLDLDGVPDLANTARWNLGVSAVIEETNGRKSYWALAHPVGRADFHHPDCFALELPPAFPS